MIYLTIGIPIHNEEDTIKNVIEDHIRVLHFYNGLNFEIFIIDDGSTDNSKQIVQRVIEENQSAYSILLYSNKMKCGIVRSLDLIAEKANGNFIYFTSGDNQFSSEEFSKALDLQMQTNLDLVILKRINKKSIYTFPRLILSQLYRLIFLFLTGADTLDPGSAKIIRKELYLKPTSCTSIIREAEIVARAIKFNARYGTVPINFKPRLKGRSRIIRLENLAKIGIDLLINWRSLSVLRRGLKSS